MTCKKFSEKRPERLLVHSPIEEPILRPSPINSFSLLSKNPLSMTRTVLFMAGKFGVAPFASTNAQDILVESPSIRMANSIIIWLMTRELACIGSYLNILFPSMQGAAQTRASFESTRDKESINSASSYSGTNSSSSWTLLIRFGVCFRVRYLSFVHFVIHFRAMKQVGQGEKVEDPPFTPKISSASAGILCMRSEANDINSVQYPWWCS